MALSDTVLGQLIAEEIDKVQDTQDTAILEGLAGAIAKAIVSHITAAAVVTLNNGVDSNGDSLIDLTGKIS